MYMLSYSRFIYITETIKAAKRITMIVPKLPLCVASPVSTTSAMMIKIIILPKPFMAPYRLTSQALWAFGSSKQGRFRRSVNIAVSNYRLTDT
jgi:hypothetical protein